MHREPVIIEGSDLLARCVQHETDHLDGILFIDRLDTVARKAAMKEIRKSEWFGGPGPGRPVQPALAAPRARLMRVLFAGTPEVAVPALSAPAVSPHEVVAVLTRPDAPAGRGRRLTPSPVAEVALAEAASRSCVPGGPAIPTSSTAWRGSAPTRHRSWPTGGSSPPAALALPTHGWINLHFSLLPAWRGAAPVQHA